MSWCYHLATLIAVVTTTTTVIHNRCVFIHGWGQTRQTNYWGSVAHWVEPLCRNSTFLWMDTVNNGWMDTRLHNAVASAVHGQGSCLVFTHSMGGLVFAEAVRRHIIDNPLTRWRVAAGTPWYGSPLATAARRICESDNDPRRLLLRDVGQCDTQHGQVPRALLQLTDTTSLKVLRDWMLSNGTTGPDVTLCGNNPWGFSDWFGLQYSAIKDLFGVNHELTTQHDGVVPLKDCTWTSSYKQANKQYKLSRNHADLSCGTHDDTVCTLYGLID
jgi:hypothetical protein